MSLGINKPEETYFLEVKLMDNEVLRVTQDGQFIWHPDADRMIEEGDYSTSPAMPHILRVLRKREWVGLTDEQIDQLVVFELGLDADADIMHNFARAIEAKLKQKNGYAEEKNT